MGEIKKQSISNSIISYIGAGLGFLIIYIQPNLIPSSDIGLMRLLYSYSWMTAVLMPLGIGSITLRYFSKIQNKENQHNGHFGLLILIASIGAIIVGLLLLLFKAQITDYYQNSRMVSNYFFESILFGYVLALISILTVFASSLLKTTFTVFLTDVFVRIGQIVLIIVYHFKCINIDQLIYLYIGIFILQLILLIHYLYKLNAISFKINWQFYKHLPLREIGLFGTLMMFTAFASLGVKVVDQLAIGHFLDEKMVGIYATCVMICAVMEIPFNSMERIAQPKIALAWNTNNKEEVQKIYALSSKYMYFLGSVLLLFLWSGIDLVFQFLPKEFEHGKVAFYIVSISSLINLLTGVNSSVIMMSHKYFAASVFLFILFSVAAIFNNLLIEPLGITGAALATLIAIGSFNIIKFIYIYWRLGMQPFSKDTLYITISLFFCLLCIYVIPNQTHPFIKAMLGCSVTSISFLYLNIKTGMIIEINKVLRRFKLIS